MSKVRKFFRRLCTGQTKETTQASNDSSFASPGQIERERKQIYASARVLLNSFSDSTPNAKEELIHMMDVGRSLGIMFIASTEFKSAMMDLVNSLPEGGFVARWHTGPDAYERSQDLKFRFGACGTIDSMALIFLKTLKENNQLTRSLTEGLAYDRGFTVIVGDELLNAMAPHLDTEYLKLFHASVTGAGQRYMTSHSMHAGL